MRVINSSQRLFGMALMLLFFCYFVFRVYWASVDLGNQFPDNYSWSDLLISYQGGFTRRGLFGSILYYLDEIFPAQILGVIIIFITYIFVSLYILILSIRNISLGTFLFIVSPLTLLFPLDDNYIFGRKDIFIVTAFAASAMLSRRLRPNFAIGTTIALFIIAGLIHETAIIYMPLAIAFTIFCADKHTSPLWKLGAMGVAGLVAVIFVAVTMNFHGDQAIVDQVVASWRSINPRAYGSLNAIEYLAFDTGRSWEMVSTHQRNVITSAGYLIGFLLALIPVALIAGRRVECLRDASFFAKLLAIAGLLVMFVSFAVAADWGRYTYLWMMCAFIFFAALPRSTAEEQSGANSRSLPRPKPLELVVLVSYVFMFATMWHLKHFAPGGESPLVPGLLFKWMGPA